jgi:hypothetical protein
MPKAISLHATRLLPWLVCAFLAAVLASCGEDKIGKTLTVTGKVTLGGEALPSGIVTFTPDAEKGNKGNFNPTGTIGADGNYTLHTDTKDGAPPGWYKVSINTNMPPASKDMKPGETPPQPVAINPNYNDPNRSGIRIEVTESPAANAYDIPLKK